MWYVVVLSFAKLEPLIKMYLFKVFVQNRVRFSILKFGEVSNVFQFSYALLRWGIFNIKIKICKYAIFVNIWKGCFCTCFRMP